MSPNIVNVLIYFKKGFFLILYLSNWVTRLHFVKNSGVHAEASAVVYALPSALGVSPPGTWRKAPTWLLLGKGIRQENTGTLISKAGLGFQTCLAEFRAHMLCPMSTRLEGPFMRSLQRLGGDRCRLLSVCCLCSDFPLGVIGSQIVTTLKARSACCFIWKY